MRTRIAFAAALACGVMTAAFAADVDQGRTRSLACQACHGAAGVSAAADIPNLAGQKQAYIAAQLTAFRTATRKDDLMNAIASQLSDADIANLAAFWSSLPPAGGDAHAPDAAVAFRGSRMDFPKDFPKQYVLYLEENDAAQKTSSRSYVNRVALEAARAGKPLPSGSAIVVENSAGGEVKSYAAMETRAGWGADIPELLRNGDWNYALFKPTKERIEFNYARCLACHKPKADTSYVFALEKIAAAK
jgi:cytochrome c553